MNNENEVKKEVKAEVEQTESVEVNHLICPYCQSPAYLTDSSVIYGRSYGMIFLCSRHPTCDAFVGVHKATNKPLGMLANAKLRELRKQAHQQLDRFWKANTNNHHDRYIKKSLRCDVYSWLAKEMGIAEDQCHVGMMNDTQCLKVIELCKARINSVT